MKNIFSLLLFVLLLVSCNTSTKHNLSEGIWVAELAVMDNEIIPFNFKIEKANGLYTMEIYNAEEIIYVDEIMIKGDSMRIQTPVYEGYIIGRFTATSIEGEFIKESLDRVVPFKATFGEEDRFRNSKPATENISGTWEVDFSKNTEDSYISKGVFTQNGDKVKGTFRTLTGDYRYLDGVMDEDSLKVSAFDGAHAFVFTAKATDSTLNGNFYSGNHWKEPFEAVRNEAFELPSADSLTFLKKGYDKFAFSFPNASGEMVSLDDERFKNKVVLVQIMGTWCPNCLDETKFYVDYLKNNPNTDFEIVGLAFEYAKTKEGALHAISRLKERIGVEYPILLAQVGTDDKKITQQKLPMLNHVISYPTSIFIDKKGEVRKIHTGFNGPATGDKYIAFKKEFDVFIKGLLEE